MTEEFFVESEGDARVMALQAGFRNALIRADTEHSRKWGISHRLSDRCRCRSLLSSVAIEVLLVGQR